MPGGPPSLRALAGKRSVALEGSGVIPSGNFAHSLTDHLATWETELGLSEDPDSVFLLDGIAKGFRLTDEGSTFVEVETDNYSSTTTPEAVGMVHEQIRTEVENGRYVVTTEKPTIVSALGAIPKGKDKIRLIHDCSRPVEGSLNSFASLEPVKFQSVSEAASMVGEGYYMAKIDLEAAYRSVLVHPDDHAAMGLKWVFEGDKLPTYMYDSRLPFGARKAPGIFHRITQGVKQMMIRRGFRDVVVYLDDWILISTTREGCQQAMTVLLELLRSLGFSISYRKVEPPTTSLVFLGIQIDSVKMQLPLPQDKVRELHTLVDSYALRRHASLKQLQSLAGKLVWACQVVRGGRSFIRRILDYTRLLRGAIHKVKLGNDFFKDLSWWQHFLTTFMGKSISVDSYRPTVAVEADSCSLGMGVVCGTDWFYVDWAADAPDIHKLHINHKETAAIVVAARRWAPQWEGKSVTVFTDNQTAMHIVNRGTSADPTVMELLRELFWLSVMHNFSLSANYLQVEHNIFADTVSRLGSNSWLLQWVLLNQIGLYTPDIDAFADQLHLHMPDNSLITLLPQIRKLGNWQGSSTSE